MKHNIIKASIFGFIILALFSKCDIVNEPYEKNITPCPEDTTKPKILLDYFTAHKCINCPAGSSRYKALQSQYPDKIIVVAIHGGSLSIPEKDDSPEAQYTYDFRSPIGTELFLKYKAETTGLPCGMVGRTEHNGKKVLQYPD